MGMQLFPYEAVVAKCRCISGQLLTKAQYIELSRKKNLAEAATYLKENTSYANVLEEVDVTRIRRSEVEYLLQKDVFDLYVKLYTFTYGNDRKYIGHLLEEVEISYLLNAVRALKTKDSVHYSPVSLFFASHSKLDYNQLFSAKTVSALLDVVTGTPYAPIFQQILQQKNTLDFTALEVALYNDYYKRLYEKYAGEFDGENKRILREIIGTKADMLNMARIIRLKRFAQYEKAEGETIGMDEIIPYLMPIRNKLKPDDIRILATFTDTQQILDYCDELYFKNEKNFPDADSHTEYSTVLLYRYYRRLLQNAKASFCVPIGLLSLKEIEIKNLIYIMEGIRYSVPTWQIEQHIIVK